VTELVRFELADGGSVVAELDDSPGVSRVGRQSVLETAKGTLESALSDVRDAAAAALAQFQDMAQKPDELEIKFGVKLDAQAGAIIARTGMQGHFEVKVRWIQDGARL
jgi:Trypsin-co-occurring domain 1